MFSEIFKRYTGKLADYKPCASILNRMAWEKLDEEWKKATVRLGEQCLKTDWPYLKATDYMDFTRTGSRERYEKKFFDKRRTLDALVLAECVENQGRFLDEIVNGIYAICDESAWNVPAHNYYVNQCFLPLPDVDGPIPDLFACDTGATLATVSYLLQPVLDKLSPLILKRVNYELNRRIFQPYLNRHFWWMGDGTEKMTNWTAWCTKNVLLTIFLTGTEQELRFRTVQKACKSMDYFLDQYGEDGCCDEGVGYCRAGGLSLLWIIDVLNSASKNAFSGLSQTEKIRNIASFAYKMHVSDKYYINYSDCSAVAGRCTVNDYLFGKLTGQRDVMAFAAADYQSGLPDTLLYAKEYNLFNRLLNGFTARELKSFDTSKQTSPPDVFYPSNGVMVTRDSHFVLAGKAGDNADSHNHNDVGSFIIYKDGRPLFIDIGVETYNKKTFSAQRYEIWTMQSSWHNLPAVDNIQQKDGEKYHAVEVNCDLGESMLSMDIAKAYPESALKYYKRTIQLKKGDAIYIQDTFTFMDDKPHQIILSLITYDRPVPGMENKNGQKILLTSLNNSEKETALAMLYGGRVITIEEVPILDNSLAKAWEHSIYRMLIEPVEGSQEINLVIK